MRHLIGSRLSYANVTATVALFVALGGASYAAFSVPANSVGTKQLQDGAVTGAKVKARALTTRDFSRSAQAALRGPKGDTGSRGAHGAQGIQGNRGLPGSPAASALMGGTDLTSGSPLSATQTQFLSASGISAPTMFESSTSVLSPNTTIVARDLSIGLGIPVGGGTRTFTLRVNGTDSGLSCEVTTGTTCNSGSAQVTIPPGSTLSIESVPSGSPPLTVMQFGWRATTP